MSIFEKELPTYRLAETFRNDTLQRVAAREMGDANRWPELIWLNNLVSPYLTDDPDQAGDAVLLNGSLIRVPAPTGTTSTQDDRAQIYERDIKMVNRRIVEDENGDPIIVAGTDNLTQQLKHRIVTPRGQAVRHPEYGNLTWQLHGTVQGPLLNMLGAQYTKACLAADYRVAAVTNTTAETIGDATTITATAEAIAGGKVDISNQ